MHTSAALHLEDRAVPQRIEELENGSMVSCDHPPGLTARRSLIVESACKPESRRFESALLSIPARLGRV